MHQVHHAPHSTRARQELAEPCSMARPDARAVTCHLYLPSRGTTLIPQKKSASMTSRQCARRMKDIEPRRYAGCGHIRKEASITTGDSQRLHPSSSTTTHSCILG